MTALRQRSGSAQQSDRLERTTRTAREFARLLFEAANDAETFSPPGVPDELMSLPRNPLPDLRQNAPSLALVIPTALHIKTLIMWGTKASHRIVAVSIAANLMACADLLDGIHAAAILDRRYDLKETG